MEKGDIVVLKSESEILDIVTRINMLGNTKFRIFGESTIYDTEFLFGNTKLYIIRKLYTNLGIDGGFSVTSHRGKETIFASKKLFRKL